jgi:competence transcription factor ComK
MNLTLFGLTIAGRLVRTKSLFRITSPPIIFLDQVDVLYAEVFLPVCTHLPYRVTDMEKTCARSRV